MMSSAVAYQMKGFGSSFQWSAQVVISCASSATLVNTPRRSRLSVSSLNQRSIRLSQEPKVGVKCWCHRRRSRWPSHVDLLEERQHVRAGVALGEVGDDLSGGDVHRQGRLGAVQRLALRFSSKLNTTARARGLRYTPMTSTSFFANRGSLLILKVSTAA
jgi:hypothetical protein